MKLIDIQSYNICNRQCSFCPPYKKGNSNKIEYITDETIINISKYINKYRDKDFIRICFNRYFEPLINLDFVIRCKNLLSNSLESLENIDYTIHTNGELLNINNVNLLINNFDSVIINFYEKDLAESYEIIAKLVDDYNIKIDYKENKLYYKNIIINYNKNQNIKLKTRGGLINIKESLIDRTSCDIYRDMIAVESNGDIMPCCELYSRNKKHERYKIGNIAEDCIDIIHNRKSCFDINNESCIKCNAEYNSVIV